TKADVVEVSPTAAKGDLLQKVAVGTGAAVGTVEVAEQTGLLEHSSSWTDHLQEGAGIFHTVKSVLDSIGVTMVLNLIRDHPFIVIAIICILVYYFAGDIIRERIKAFKSGAAPR